MKDCLMNELKVGDRVVYTRIISNCSYLHFGRVNGFTPKKVRVGAITVAPEKCVKIVLDGVNNILGASSSTEELV